MRVLITVLSYFPCDDGVSRVTQYLAEGLVSKGHNVSVITKTVGTCKKHDNHNGVEIFRVGLNTKYGINYGDRKGYSALVDEKAEKADVMVNVCTQNAFTDVLLRRLKKYNCKKVLYMHGMFNFNLHGSDFTSLRSSVNKLWKELRWGEYYLLNGRFFKRYDSIIQLHEYDYGTVFFEKKYGIKSMIIGNAVDDSFFDCKKTKHFKKPFDRYIINVANYNDRKNQKLAASAFLRSNIDQDIGLVLIGSKQNRYYDWLSKYIRSQRKKLHLKPKEKPILLLHGIEREDIPLYVSNAFLYLMTSKWEAFPVSIIESIVCGIPFVSTDVGVVRYFPGGITADRKELSHWIEEMSNNDNLRRSYSDAVSEYANADLTVNGKVSLFEDILSTVCYDKNKKSEGF